MSFIARYVYTYEEFVVVPEAPQCIRMTATWQDTDNKIIIYNIDNVQKSKNTIYNIDNCVYVQVWYVQIWNVNKNVWWLMMYNNNVVCSMFNVKCSWDGLLEGRNRSCVWSFWCSELWSVDQTVTVQRGRVLDVRVQSEALMLTLDEYSYWRVSRVVPMIPSAVRTTLRSLLRSDLVAELNQTVVDVQRTDLMMAE